MNLNNHIKCFKVFFACLSIYMIYLVVDTSLRSNLWEVIPVLNQEPWFVTTIVDFYFNIAIISAWVIYRETNVAAILLWIVAFVCLGSIATAFYVFLQLARLKPEESLETALVRKG